jgi:Ca2+-binding EF-hand superfamily protein
LNDVKTYLLKTNIEIENDKLIELFKDHDSENTGKLSFESFLSFWTSFSKARIQH